MTDLLEDVINCKTVRFWVSANRLLTENKKNPYFSEKERKLIKNYLIDKGFMELIENTNHIKLSDKYIKYGYNKGHITYFMSLEKAEEFFILCGFLEKCAK